MIPINKIWLFETDILDPYFIGIKDGIEVILENDDVIDFINIQTVTYFMNTQVKGAFKEMFKYGGEDGGIAESTGKSEKEYELEFNMPIENRDNLNRFAGSLYSLLGERVDGSKFIVFGQFEADDLEVDNRIQNRMTLSTGTTSARLFEVNSLNVENIEYIIKDVVTPAPPPIPSIPTGLTTIVLDLNKIEVFWNSQDNVNYYVLEYGTNGFTFPNVLNIYGSQNNIIVTGLNGNTTYYFRIKASNESGESAYSNIHSATTNSPTIQPETQIWISGMDSNLTQTQIDILDLFVVNEKGTANNNFALTDYFIAPQLSQNGGINGAISINGNTIGTVNGGVTFDEFGANFNGVDSYIDSNFNLLNDSILYSQNDASLNFFLSKNNSTGFTVAIGAHNTSLNIRTAFEQFNGDYIASINSNYGIPAGSLINNTDIPVGLNSLSRTTSNQIQAYLDGILINSFNAGSRNLLNQNLYIGTESKDSATSPIIDGTISSVHLGSGIGFDQAAHNTNVRLLVAGLQVNQLITDINDANNIINNGLTSWP